MNLSEAAPASLVPRVTDLLRTAGVADTRFVLTPLSGGANNQVYRVEFEDRGPLVLKHYFFSPEDGRDRFHSEKSFYDFLKASGVRHPTPQALAWDREHHLGLFSWIEGRRLKVEEVTRNAVDQALAFYIALNAHQDLPEASAVPSASEACFDLEQHFKCVERRLDRLAAIDGASVSGRDALDFISTHLKPAFAKYRRFAAGAGMAEMTALEAGRRCLSPSDFGFHNALSQSDGNLVFFDFEYAGWDDPAKFLCDFLCQPAVPVPRSLWPHCVASLCRPIPGGSRRDRIALLLPLYHLKWCCILLNEFLPQGQNRRTFSRKFSPSELEAKKREQLGKARHLFENLTGVDLIRSLGLDDATSVVT